MELKYQALVERVEDLIFTLNPQARFTYINPRLALFSGKTKADWVNKDFLKLVYPEDYEFANYNLEQVLQGRTRIFEARLLRDDGSALYFSTNMTPILENGRVTGIIGISRDINEKMKLQQELTELKNFNESIIQSMQSGLITLDLQGIVTSFNLSAEEILKVSSHQAIGIHLQNIIGEEAYKVMLPPKDSASAPNREVTVLTQNGQHIYIGFTVTPRLDDTGRRVGTIISFKDISQIKLMQAEVIRMDRLASLGVLASGIAHEIKNPLAGIKTMVQTLQEDFDESLPSRVYLDRIVRQVNRLDDLLKAFFDYARPRPPVKNYHRIHDIVHEVLSLVDQKLKKKNIILQEDFPADLPKVYVDFHQIQQVILNLILNAIDAMEAGGFLSVKTRAIQPQTGEKYLGDFALPDQKSSIPFVEVSVADSGQGIKQENLEKIFDPFFTTKSQGTGLGLSIVYRIIAAHGGKIFVDSELGKGTTFTIHLPSKE